MPHLPTVDGRILELSASALEVHRCSPSRVTRLLAVLAVAIPAVLFFNQLNAKITSVESTLAHATGELLDELENTHGDRDSGSLEKAA